MADIDERTLTAILVAEGRDAAALTAWRRDCFDPLVGRFGGHVVASGQARLLAEFDGIVDAVNCAVAAQRRSGAGPRIGINLGDLAIENHRVGGADLAYAVSLAGRALPGGICVSGVARNQVTADISPEAIAGDAGRPRYLVASAVAAAVLLAYFLTWYGLISWKTIAYALYGSFPCWPDFLCG